MNYEILPGPSLAELARTALARAAAATVSEAGPGRARQDVAGRVPVPDGPVSSLEEVPASIRTVLTCRCRSGPGHEYRRRQSRRAVGE